MRMLTPRQLAAYEFIAGFIERERYAPSYEEIGRHLNLRSLNAVAKLVAQLRRRGALAEAPFNAKRSLALVAPRRARGRVPLLGLIAAGQPIEAIENPELIDVPESLLGPGERYALRVRGDSMVEDGIRDGDLVLVRRQESAQANDIVVALVESEAGDEATVKRFQRDGDRIVLKPEHPTMAPIVIDPRERRVRILGKVVGVLRGF